MLFNTFPFSTLEKSNYQSVLYFRALIYGRATMYSKYHLLYLLVPFPLLEIAKARCVDKVYDSKWKGRGQIYEEIQ